VLSDVLSKWRRAKYHWRRADVAWRGLAVAAGRRGLEVAVVAGR